MNDAVRRRSYGKPDAGVRLGRQGERFVEVREGERVGEERDLGRKGDRGGERVCANDCATLAPNPAPVSLDRYCFPCLQLWCWRTKSRSKKGAKKAEEKERRRRERGEVE